MKSCKVSRSVLIFLLLWLNYQIVLHILVLSLFWFFLPQAFVHFANWKGKTQIIPSISHFILPPAICRRGVYLAYTIQTLHNLLTLYVLFLDGHLCSIQMRSRHAQIHFCNPSVSQGSISHSLWIWYWHEPLGVTDVQHDSRACFRLKEMKGVSLLT